jgi:GNAT superfamily N-acetyltransferase
MINYRLATPDDAIAINELYNTHGRTVNTSFDPDYPSVVAEIKNELVGFAYSKRWAPDIAELSNIFIHPHYRDKGIGSQLLNLLETKLATDYAAIVAENSMLYQLKDDKRPAKEFYLRNGWQIAFETKITTVFYKQFNESQ